MSIDDPDFEPEIILRGPLVHRPWPAARSRAETLPKLIPFMLAIACVIAANAPIGACCDKCAAATRCSANVTDCATSPGELPLDWQQEMNRVEMDLLDPTLGASSGYRSAAPNLIGDFFGAGTQQLTVQTTNRFQLHTSGFILAGAPGSPSAVLVFESSAGSPNDFTTLGQGTDSTGDNFADTFTISEPLPPNDSPVSPGPGFQFDGGTAVYTNSNLITTPQNGQFNDGDTWFASYRFTETIVVDVPSGGGSAVRRIKLMENNSPIPRDRLIASYNFFNNVPNGFGDVNRYAFGFEKTFLDRTMSLDVRFPFAATLASDQIADAPGSKDTEFGNMSLAWKAIVFDSATMLVSAGLGASLPTADDTRVFRSDGRQVLLIDSESIHLLPFVAMLYFPTDILFVQGAMQFDFDVNGHSVSGDPMGVSLASIGRLRDASLLFLDVTAGCWLYQSNGPGITGVAPVAELHYASTLEDNPSVSGAGISVNSLSNRFDVLNMTAGVHFFLDDRVTITPSVAFPLRKGDDRQFDCEAMLQANWYF